MCFTNVFFKIKSVTLNFVLVMCYFLEILEDILLRLFSLYVDETGGKCPPAHGQDSALT